MNTSIIILAEICIIIGFFFRFVDASFIGGGLPLLHMAATSPFLAKVDA